MTPEERSLLQRIASTVEENNQILIGMRRRARYATVFRVLYWVVIIGLSVGAFYFIQPYIEFMTSALGIGGNEASSGSSFENYTNNLKNLFQ
ncbi:MAG TPA: hypothetical protein VJI66_02705 [Candidatus Paceibacterota bacterium]